MKAKRDAHGPWVRELARRQRQPARRLKQRERQRRKRARQVRKKEEEPVGPGETAMAKEKKLKGKLVDQKVKKILMRAPLKASERTRSSCEPKAEQIKGGSNHGWKAGLCNAASETAPARRSKKLPTTLVLKLLKKAMNLEKTSDQRGLTSPKEDLKKFKQDQLYSDTPEDREPDDHGVVLEGIGPDFSADMPDLSKMAREGSNCIIGLAPESSDGKKETNSSPCEKCDQDKPRENSNSVRQATPLKPRENSNSERQATPLKVSHQNIVLQLPSEAEKAKLRRRKRESVARRKGCDNRSVIIGSSEEDEDTDKRSRAKVSKPPSQNIPCLTDTSDDEEEPKERRETCGSMAVLTDSSEDEEEAERVGKPKVFGKLAESSVVEPMKGMKVQIHSGDFRGGGAAGSNYYVWLQLAERIMVGVRRAQLPLRLPLNDITEGDGNCYFRAVLSQCQRPEVAAPEEIKHLDHRSLRRNICNFMLKSQLPVVLHLKQRWSQFCLGDYGKYWKDMAESRGDIWAEGPVIHATAWYLERHIYVVSEQSTVDDPLIPFCGNQDGSDRPCAGAALWLGHLTGLHYQTLMLDKSQLMPPLPKMQTIKDTLKSKAQAAVKGGDQPGTSRKSNEVEVSVRHCLSN